MGLVWCLIVCGSWACCSYLCCLLVCVYCGSCAVLVLGGWFAVLLLFSCLLCCWFAVFAVLVSCLCVGLYLFG